MNGPTISLQNVTKRFGPVVAVRDASLRFVPARIHAVVGENGAGKSTALKMAAGSFAPSDGHVLIDDAPLAPATPREATLRGVGFVHQHFMLVDALTALENVILGAEPTRGLGRLDMEAAEQRAKAVRKQLGINLDLHARVGKLGVGERQYLEILRVLVRGARAILLDEPTAVLTPGQAEKLFGLLRTLASNGSTVVVVTHRLDEVMKFCDDVTVMHRGRTVLDGAVEDTTRDALTRAIMGKEPPPPVQRPPLPEQANPTLRIEGLTVPSARGDGTDGLRDVSLSVAGGEIVGVAGIEGNGQQEMVHALTGTVQPSGGHIFVKKQDVTGLDVRTRRDAGLAVVQADRHREGLLLDASLSDNLILGDLPLQDEVSTAKARMEHFDVRPAELSLPVSALSGGNQQKVVTARALDRSPKAIVLAQPTRGVDLGAAAGIHEAICDAASRGAAVLVLSADLSELRAVCHRVLVLSRGQIVADLPPETSEQVFGEAMLGQVDRTDEGTSEEETS